MVDEADLKLITNALRGHESGYRSLVDRYKNEVYSLCFRWVRHRENAEELSQDVFLKIFRALPSFRFDSKFSTWVYRITYTTCMSFLRRKNISTCELSELPMSHTVDESEESGAQYDRQLKKEFIRQAITKLGSEDAGLIHLYYFLDQSLAEIQQVTDVPAEVLKVRLFRARKKLRLYLQSVEKI